MDIMKLLIIIIVSLLFFSYIIAFILKSRVAKKVGKNNAVVKGMLTDICQTVRASVNGFPAYSAVLSFTTKKGRSIRITHSQHLPPFEVLQKKVDVQVTVCYSIENPKLYYIKELNVSPWRYIAAASIFFIVFCSVIWIIFFAFE